MPEILEAAKGVPDQVTTALAFPVVAHGPIAVRPAGDDGRGTRLAERTPEEVGVIVFVRKDVADTAHTGEQLGRGIHIGTVAGRQKERIQAANDIDERVDLRGPAAARAADRLRSSPPRRRTRRAGL